MTAPHKIPTDWFALSVTIGFIILWIAAFAGAVYIVAGVVKVLVG